MNIEAKLHARQKKILDKWATTSLGKRVLNGVIDYDSLPEDLRNDLEKVKFTETLWRDAERHLEDLGVAARFGSEQKELTAGSSSAKKVVDELWSDFPESNDPVGSLATMVVKGDTVARQNISILARYYGTKGVLTVGALLYADGLPWRPKKTPLNISYMNRNFQRNDENAFKKKVSDWLDDEVVVEANRRDKVAGLVFRILKLKQEYDQKELSSFIKRRRVSESFDDMTIKELHAWHDALDDFESTRVSSDRSQTATDLVKMAKELAAGKDVKAVIAGARKTLGNIEKYLKSAEKNPNDFRKAYFMAEDFKGLVSDLKSAINDAEGGGW